MESFGSIAWSSVGKKVITGVTGLLLFGFVCVHLIGNLTIFIGPGAFNAYAHFLESLAHGWFVYAFEIGLIAIFVFHMASTVTVAWLDKMQARRDGYKYSRNAGGTSRKTLASRSMIYSGILIIVFVIGHVWMFKFGDHAMVTASGGIHIKDYWTTVDTAFQELPIVIWYVAIMLLLGMHLWHGFWSAFQSLGLASDRWLPLLTVLARVFAFLLAVGFLILPVCMYFDLVPTAAAGGH